MRLHNTALDNCMQKSVNAIYFLVMLP